MNYTEKKLKKIENTLQGCLYLLTQSKRRNDIDIMEIRSRVCKALYHTVDLRCLEYTEDDADNTTTSDDESNIESDEPMPSTQTDIDNALINEYDEGFGITLDEFREIIKKRVNESENTDDTEAESKRTFKIEKISEKTINADFNNVRLTNIDNDNILKI